MPEDSIGRAIFRSHSVAPTWYAQDAVGHGRQCNPDLVYAGDAAGRQVGRQYAGRMAKLLAASSSQ